MQLRTACRRLSGFAPPLALAALLGACDPSSGPGQLTFSADSLSLAWDDTVTAQLVDELRDPVRWSSADRSVVTVDSLGRVHARRTGRTVITAESADRRGEIAVTVTLRLTAIAAAHGHSCGLAPSGRAICWGDNTYGQLGSGIDTLTGSPVPLIVTGANRYTSIVAGRGWRFDAVDPAREQGGFTCAIAASDGSVWCWGAKMDALLGASVPDTPYEGVGTPIRLQSGGMGPATALAAGFWHACALAADGIWCWGRNQGGQLGFDGGASRCPNGSRDGGPCQRTPVRVALTTARNSTVMAAGADFTCATDANAEAYCWGANAFGQLGDGAPLDRYTTRPAPTRVLGGRRFTRLAAGRSHACGLDTDGVAWCWGDNRAGQVGSGRTDSIHAAPVAVSGGLRFANLAASDAFTCGTAADGATWCWGANLAGQLGDGTGESRAIPTRVLGAADLRTIVLGHRHTCGVDAAGAATCWGNNDRGQLGNGLRVGSTRPVHVTGPR